MKSLHVLLLVVISTTLFHLGSAEHAITCQNDVIFVQDVGDFGGNVPLFSGITNSITLPGNHLAISCNNERIHVRNLDSGSFSVPLDLKNGRILIKANTGDIITLHVVTCNGNELYDANFASKEFKISETLEGDVSVIGCENNVIKFGDKNIDRREAKTGVHTISRPCNIIQGVSTDEVAFDLSGHTMNKLHCVNVGNTAKTIMIGSERFESLSCDNYGWKGKPIGEGKDLVEIIDDNFILTMSCVDYSGNEPTKVASLSPPVTTAVPTIPPTIPSTPITEVPTTTTTEAAEQTTPYPIDYARAHQLISCKQDIIFVQDPSGLQISAPVKSVYLGGKVAVTCKNDIIYVVQPCGSTRSIPSGNANGEAVKVLLNSNTNEQLTSIHILTCKDNEMYAANLTSDELQIHEKFDFDNLTIWCENNVHYIKDKRTGKIVGENRGRREAKIGMRSGAFEITGDMSYEVRRK